MENERGGASFSHKPWAMGGLPGSNHPQKSVLNESERSEGRIYALLLRGRARACCDRKSSITIRKESAKKPCNAPLKRVYCDCCDKKAMKREVAVFIYLPYETGFPRSKCHVHETGDKSLYNCKSSAQGGNNVLCSGIGHTRRCVQSPIVVIRFNSEIRMRLFYGKSGNENHIEGL
jgi:hypothetical protein